MQGATDILRKISDVDLSFLKRLTGILPAAALLVAATVIFYRYVYIAGVKELAAISAGMAAAQGDMAKIKAQSEAADRLRSEIERVAEGLRLADERLRLLNERLPASRRISKIVEEISGAGAGQGGTSALRILAIKPLEPEEKGELVRLPFQIVAESRFQAFGEYLERIEDLTRVMLIDNFMIEAREDGAGLLTSQLYLSAYVMGASSSAKAPATAVGQR